MVEVKINGEVQQVPLSEALAGYSRTMDYTQKTQELASQRSQIDSEVRASIRAEIDRDPQGFISSVASEYGISGVGSQTANAQFNDDYVDPQVKQLQGQVETLSSSLQEQQRTTEIERQLDQVQRDVDPNVDRRAVLQYAVDNGIPSLLHAYRSMKFDELQAPAQQQQTAHNAILAQKTGLPGIVSPGSSRGAQTTAQATGIGEVNNVGDAWQNAKRELGL